LHFQDDQTQEARPIRCDVADPDAMEKLAEHALSEMWRWACWRRA
jgi:hypothetical protein